MKRFIVMCGACCENFDAGVVVLAVSAHQPPIWGDAGNAEWGGGGSGCANLVSHYLGVVGCRAGCGGVWGRRTRFQLW